MNDQRDNLRLSDILSPDDRRLQSTSSDSMLKAIEDTKRDIDAAFGDKKKVEAVVK